MGGEGHVAPAWEGVPVHHAFHHVQPGGTHGTLWTEPQGSHWPHCGWGRWGRSGSRAGPTGPCGQSRKGLIGPTVGEDVGEAGEPGGTHGPLWTEP